MAEAVDRGSTSPDATASFPDATPINLDRDLFMRRLIASLGHLNEGILGSDVAGAYIMNVGLSMGAAIEEQYKRFWGIDRPFTLDEYAHVIVDLKQKIHGNFSIVSKDPEKVVVQTTSCPFDMLVRQSPSLCFMTSSVFGGIAARNFGYAKVALQKRIAMGDDGCYVVVHLRHTPEAEASLGKEYFPDSNQASPDIAEQLRLMQSVSVLRQELGEVSSRWEEVVRAAADAIMLVNAHGQVVYANSRWRDILGVEGGELQGGTVGPLAHPDDREGALQAYERALQGERILGHLVRARHRDGSWRELSLSLSPVRGENGEITGVLGIAHDVTEEREAQRLKDDFLITASHELRTPVSTIKAITQVLLRQIERNGELEPAQIERRLQTIQRETDRLALLGADLADAARLQKGSVSVERERHNLNAIAAACMARLQETSQRLDGHEIVLQTVPGALPVAVDRVRIERVVSNLLENAIKYSPEGGRVTIKTEHAGAEARLSVTDEGIGIPASDMGKLFQPFYRASNASTRHFSGLGLGLYLSQAIALAHQGRIRVTSVEGQGATFVLALPLLTDESASSPEASDHAD